MSQIGSSMDRSKNRKSWVKAHAFKVGEIVEADRAKGGGEWLLGRIVGGWVPFSHAPACFEVP